MKKFENPKKDSKNLVYNAVIDMNRPVDQLPMRKEDNSEQQESAENFSEE